MRVHTLPGKSQLLPSRYVYPTSLDNLNEALGNILPESVAHASFEVYENTSDVLIMSDFWNTAVDLWTIRVIAVKETDLVNVQRLLKTKGFSALKEWLIGADDDLRRRADAWVYHTLILRYEHNDLISEISQADRPDKRPPPRRPMP